MEIARAQIQRPEKGEDDYLVRPIHNNGSVQLLAVADGLSLNGGKAAACWVIDYLRRVTDIDSPRTIFEAIKRELAQSRYQVEQSETTLTCGILRQVGTEEDAFLRFEYFAIGDSPIWKVVVGDSKYPFQRVLIHGSPYPAETARVYSTVRLHEGDIKGVVTFGAVEVASGEVLVVCTDGIPEREVFVRDFSNPGGEGSGIHGLCRWLFQQLPYYDEDLTQVLENYDHRGILFDDATIIAARLAPPPVNPEDSQTASSVTIAGDTESVALLQKLHPDGTSPSVEADASLASENQADSLSDCSEQSVFSASDVMAQPGVDQVAPEGNYIVDEVSTEQSATSSPDGENELSPIQGGPASALNLEGAPECASGTEGIDEMTGSKELPDDHLLQTGGQRPYTRETPSSSTAKDVNPNAKQARQNRRRKQ